MYVPSSNIMSELRCHGNLLMSSKTAPLCLRQVLVVRMSIKLRPMVPIQVKQVNLSKKGNANGGP